MYDYNIIYLKTIIQYLNYWLCFWNFESEKFSGEIKIGQAELMNVHYGQVFQFTFRTLAILFPKNYIVTNDSRIVGHLIYIGKKRALI